MNDGHLTDGHRADGHLTDEQLSSHLDSVHTTGTDEVVAPAVDRHLSGCPSCRRRLAALESVRGHLRTPVAPMPPEVRAASIEMVLARLGANEPDGGITVIGPTGIGAGGEPNIRVRPGGPDAPIPIPRRRPQVLVGAAAAVLALAVIIGVPLALVGHATSNSAQSTSAVKVPKAARASSGADHRAPASGAAGLPASATATIYNFGKVSSVSALRSRVTALPTNEFSGQAPTNTLNQSASSATGNAYATETRPSGSFGTPGQFERCLSPAMQAAGPARIVRSVAIATLKGSPTLVYVFRPESNGPATGNAARTAVVAATLGGCKIITTTYL